MLNFCNPSSSSRSILPSSPSDDDDERKNAILTNEDDDGEYPERDFDKGYDEEKELQRIKARREDELARRRNEVLPQERQARQGKMEVMKMGDWVSGC